MQIGRYAWADPLEDPVDEGAKGAARVHSQLIFYSANECDDETEI